MERQIEEQRKLSSLQVKKLDDVRDEYDHELSRSSVLKPIVSDLKEELRSKEIKYRSAKDLRYMAEKSMEDTRVMATERKARQGVEPLHNTEEAKARYKAGLQKLVGERRDELNRRLDERQQMEKQLKLVGDARDQLGIKVDLNDKAVGMQSSLVRAFHKVL